MDEKLHVYWSPSEGLLQASATGFGLVRMQGWEAVPDLPEDAVRLVPIAQVEELRGRLNEDLELRVRLFAVLGLDGRKTPRPTNDELIEAVIRLRDR